MRRKKKTREKFRETCHELNRVAELIDFSPLLRNVRKSVQDSGHLEWEGGGEGQSGRREELGELWVDEL